MDEARFQLRTPRCVLRPLGTADAGELHALWTSPGVRRFLWDGELVPAARTRSAVEQSQRMFESQGVGMWGAWPIGVPSLGGFGGLWPFRDPPELELLYGVAEPLWGRGFGTEIALSVIQYCFDVLDMRAIRASTDVANAASIRVLQKARFRVVRRETVAGLDTVFFELRRPGPERS